MIQVFFAFLDEKFEHFVKYFFKTIVNMFFTIDTNIYKKYDAQKIITKNIFFSPRYNLSIKKNLKQIFRGVLKIFCCKTNYLKFLFIY